MKLWIARDEDGRLYLYDDEPIKFEYAFQGESHVVNMMELDEEAFPSITFENSPRQVELKLVEL